MTKKSTSGYILILVATFIPLLLLGTKYLLDTQTLFDRKASGTEFLKNNSPETDKKNIEEKTSESEDNTQAQKTESNIPKNNSYKEKKKKWCAKEAALKVAEKWNPALTYRQQKESMLRIADGIYNGAPTYIETLLNQAIPQIDTAREIVKKGGMFDPIRIIKTPDTYKSTVLGSAAKQIAYKQITLKRIEHNYHKYSGDYNSSAAFHNYNNLFDFLLKKDRSILLPEEDMFEDYCFLWGFTEIFWGFGWAHYESWSEEEIRAAQDSQIIFKTKTYEIRENPNDSTVKIECEKDRIKVTTDKDVGYAIPAECNVDIILTVPTNAEACTFYEENIKFENSELATLTSKVKSTPIYQITQAYRKFLKDQFFYTRGVTVGVIPYGGSSTEKLDGTKKKQGLDAFQKYYLTNLPSKNSLNSPLQNQFQEFDSNLPAKYYKNYGGYSVNPYYVLNLCPDVKFIHGMLGAFYPYRDEKNLSNFIFISIMLADDLLQEQNASKKHTAINTNFDPVGSNATYGRLSIPSSAETNRKKVLILTVNKPDWFAREELMTMGKEYEKAMKNLSSYDLTEAERKITQDSCKKLKNDWGKNLRIYLIKFRKQDNYLNENTKSLENFDYSYLNDCATENTDQYVKDNILNQAELDKVLRTIANDIKFWAGYTKAKNVSAN